LKRWEIAEDRIALIVNRAASFRPAVAQLADTLGRPVFKSIRTTILRYATRCWQERPVPAGSRLGKVFSEMAVALDSAGPSTANCSAGRMDEQAEGPAADAA